jgi:hypothetical protein
MRKSMRETHEAKREEALDRIRHDVAEGRLVIRQMTGEERARYARDESVPLRAARRR